MTESLPAPAVGPRPALRALRACECAWRVIRHVTGDDAYERYLEHWRAHHATGGDVPPSRAAFVRAEQARKWEGIRRCC